MKFTERLKRSARNPFVLVFSALLFIEILYLFHFNLVHSAKSMDQDAAKLMTHMLEIVKTGKLLIPNWRYMTTHEIDSAMLLAIPFYVISGDLYFSYALSNIIFIIALLAVVLTIFRNLGIKIDMALAATCLIFVPYSFGMLAYLNMLFVRGAQYSIKILLPLMGIMILTFREMKRKRDIALSVVWVLLLFISSFSSGLFPVVSGLLPITAAYLVNIFFRKDKEGEVSRFRSILLVCSLAVSFIGFAIHQHCQISPSGINASITFAEDFGERIHTNIGNFLKLINALPASASTKTPLVSKRGVGFMLRFGYAVFLLIGSAYFIRLFFKEKEAHDDTAQTGANYMAAIIIVNILIHLLCSYNKSRYYLIELLCMMILAGVLFSRLSSHFEKPAKILMRVALAASVFLIWYTSKSFTADCVATNNFLGYCDELCDYFSGSGVDNVIIIDSTETDEVCRLKLPEMKFSHYYSATGEFISYDWYTTTDERSYYGDSSLIVTKDYDSIEPVFGAEAASHYEYVETIADFRIFRSEEFCLPLD